MNVKGYMGSVELDADVLTVRKKVTGTTVIPIGNVQAVSIVGAGLGMKAIRFAVAGSSVHGTQTFTGSHSKLAQDPLALTFRSGRVGEFEEFAAEVQRALATR